MPLSPEASPGSALWAEFAPVSPLPVELEPLAVSGSDPPELPSPVVLAPGLLSGVSAPICPECAEFAPLMEWEADSLGRMVFDFGVTAEPLLAVLELPELAESDE